MKTLQQIKETYAGTLGYKSWLFLMLNESAFKIQKYNDDVANLYAIEVAKQALKNASNNSVMKVHDGHFKTDSPSKHVQIGANNIQVCKESILNENNIPEI